MNAIELNEAVGRDDVLKESIERADLALIEATTNVMVAGFHNVLHIEHHGRRLEDAAALSEAFWATARILFSHLDEVGITDGLARHRDAIKEFGFVNNIDLLMLDHYTMVHTLKVPLPKAMEYWHFCDRQRPTIHAFLSKSHPRLAPLAAPGHQAGLQKGDDWQHMSPVKWSAFFGGIAIGLNAAAAVGSAGVATPLLIASAAAGLAGLAAA